MLFNCSSNLKKPFSFTPIHLISDIFYSELKHIMFTQNEILFMCCIIHTLCRVCRRAETVAPHVLKKKKM